MFRYIKNNKRDISQMKQRFTIKKFKFGATSVLIGLVFLGAGSLPVHAIEKSIGNSLGIDRNAVADQQVPLGNAEYTPKARLVVTKSNMKDYLATSGSASYGNNENTVTLTQDVQGQSGSLTLVNKINMNESFRLEGKVNLGDKYEGYAVNGRSGGDGIAAVFTTAEPGTVGLSGASIGLGGIANSFGFKLDTWHNTSAPNVNQKAGMDPKFNGYQEGAFGAFYNTDRVGKAVTLIGDAKRLDAQPKNNEFKNLIVDYNGSTKVMTITYEGQVFSKNIQMYLDATRTTTKQAKGLEELSFALFGSTGSGTNLQQFDLTKFEYSSGGSYIKVRYVDDTTGELIQEKLHVGNTSQALDLTDKLSLAGHVLKRTNEDTAEGYQRAKTIAFKLGLQTVTYTYKQVNKEQLKKLVDGDAGLKQTNMYMMAPQAEKDAYDEAVQKGQAVLNDASADQAVVDEAVNDIMNKINALKLSFAKVAVKAAEDAAKAGQDKKAEVEADGIVNPADKAAVDNLNNTTTEKKNTATPIVDALPDGAEKEALKERLAKVMTSDVVVNDKDSNGKKDDEDKALSDAEAAVKAAEDAAKAGQDKKAEVEADGIVNPADKAAVDNLNNTTTEKKNTATPIVDALPDGPEKEALKERLAKVMTSDVVVNDKDSNGKKDDEDKALSDAEAAVKAAEDAAKAGQDKKAEVEADGIVNPADKAAVDNLNNTTTEKKNTATPIVDALPDGPEKEALKERLAKVMTSDVVVNDKDSNGKKDDEDKALSDAEAAVKAAEDAAKAGQDKKAEVEADGIVNPADKAAVDNLNNTTTEKKNTATPIVDALPDGPEKDALKERLAKVMTSDVVVNDKDSNGKKDDEDKALSDAEAAVKAAEDAAKAGQDKKAEVEADGIVNPADKATVDNLNNTTTEKKNTATPIVDALPDGAEKEALKERLAKVMTSDVVVNDKDSNGKKDDEDKALSDAEAAVKAAEDAAKAGQDKKAEVEADGIVNPADKAAVDNLNNTTTEKKNTATPIVDALPDGAEKEALKERLAKVMTSDVVVNDKDSNGKKDDEDKALSDAEAAVKAAEDAAKAGQDKKAEVEADGIVNPADKAAVDNLNNTTTEKKNTATPIVDALPDGPEKEALKERLAKVMTSDVVVNDKDSNGKKDDEDKALSDAEAAVKAAEDAAKAGQDKKAEVEADGIVNPADKATVDNLNNTTTEKKNTATPIVDALPDGAEKEALKERLAKVMTSDVVVNDKDSNGKKDDEDKAKMSQREVDNGSHKRISRSTEKQLPQTGTNDTANTTTIGLLMASLGVSSFVFGRRKKCDD